MTTYTRDIPFPTHNPSNDQPNMLNNTNAIDDLLKIDHVSFNDPNSGKHIHVTFPATQPTPALVSGQTEIFPQTFGSGATYLETFTSFSTNGGSQINGYLPLVKGMAKTVSQAGPYPVTLNIITADTLNINVASIIQNSSSQITVTFTTALPYNTYYIFIASFISNFTVVKSTTNFVITSSAFSIINPFEFMVI